MHKYQANIEAVIERDGACCVMCGSPNFELHHVCNRARFGAKRQADCWSVKNMLLLCPTCHRLGNKQGGSHTHAARVRHLGMLAERYGYEYDEAPWSQYVG